MRRALRCSSRSRLLLPILLLSVCLLLANVVQGQTVRLVRFGDFESWCVRYIPESAVIGGNTRCIYAVGPADTLRGPVVYKGNTPWSNSNAYARVMGVTKTSCSVTPDHSHDGSTCAKLETRYEELKVAGLVNIRILVSGCLFWGRQNEPLNSVSSPYSLMTWGVPFTSRPSAVVLDYRSLMPNKGVITTCKPASRGTRKGNDAQEVLFVLQRRWETPDGHIHALRVGTAVYRIEQPSDGWVKHFRIPLIYGDARRSSAYRPYMGLGPKGVTYYARNSRGKMVPIEEEGWADANATPTHAMMIITASTQEAFSGTLGNTLWVDNIGLEY